MACELSISQLVEYAVRKEWISDEDRIWAVNRIMEVLEIADFAGFEKTDHLPDIQDILTPLCDYAYEKGLIGGNSAAYYDLLDTKLVGLLVPKPSDIIKVFNEKYQKSPIEATQWYYAFSGDTNYIRRERIKKDQKWQIDSEYGLLDITINLSKPEKDPKAIAAAGKQKSTGYPKCLLCAENEGFAGHLNHPARQNHRIIPITLQDQPFFMQYSPYVYYNEHCIVFNKEHTPMHIDRSAFENLLDFITVFPHYMIGSNADLPIVGGSVLSHDHYQGGNYEFPMARAQVEETFVLPGYEDLTAGIVKWPMSVIRLSGMDKSRVAQAAEYILKKWRSYSDPTADIFCETDGELHATITPIARRRNGAYELDLVLRNNITTEEHPMGLFHAHADKHHIKKENIGLIEVMGLAILPARLNEEFKVLADAIVSKEDLQQNPKTQAHAAWGETMIASHPELNADNVMDIIREEAGKVFCAVLEDAGVYKRTQQGREAFRRFIAQL